MKTFQIPAILEGIAPLKDGGLSLRFHTNEVQNSEKVTVMDYFQKFGWLLFSEDENPEVPMESIRRDTGSKTPSQRLRGALFVLYQQSGDSSITFEEFYARKMEKFIDLVKQNLN